VAREPHGTALNVGVALAIAGSADGGVHVIVAAAGMLLGLAVALAGSLPEWAIVSAPIATTAPAPATAEHIFKLMRTRPRFIACTILLLDCGCRAGSPRLLSATRVIAPSVDTALLARCGSAVHQTLILPLTPAAAPSENTRISAGSLGHTHPGHCGADNAGQGGSICFDCPD
jgi:hypothetical protein